MFYLLEFIGKSVNLEETSMDRVDNIVVDLPTVDTHLEGVIKIFLQCLISPLATIVVLPTNEVTPITN
jgi:hypothetical protein